MDNRTLYFGSASAATAPFPFAGHPGRQAIEGYAAIMESSVREFRAGLQFALIEIIEFRESDRRSTSIVFSDLPKAANADIIQRHYDIIRDLKRAPGMDWSLLAANVVQFGPAIFCYREPHGEPETRVPSGAQHRWSAPSSIILPGDYKTTQEPDESRVMAKLEAYAQRVASTLMTRGGILHVLVVPFSVLDGAGSGRKLGAACILIDAAASIQDQVMQDIYAKAQLFWLRFCAAGGGTGTSAAA